MVIKDVVKEMVDDNMVRAEKVILRFLSPDLELVALTLFPSQIGTSNYYWSAPISHTHEVTH